MPNRKTNRASRENRESREARRRRTQNYVIAAIGLLVILSFLIAALRP